MVQLSSTVRMPRTAP